MAARMEFCLLGPLTVRCAGAVVRIPPGKQRALLAALLLNAGRVVSLDELAETLWGAQPPPSARVSAQNYVMRLRKTLSVAGRPLINTQPGGYLISVDAGELDATRFEELLGAAWEAARNRSWETTAGQARAALALWRGEPLADVGSELLSHREAPRLTEMRLQALETRIDADLHLGRHTEVIAELRGLVTAHPMREQLHALLMLALYRDSRQGDALAAYRHARSVLIEELGIEPGPDLRELHQRILASDPGLSPAELAVGGPARTAEEQSIQVAPRQLPIGVAHFVGREAELAALSGLLAGGAAPPGIAVISAIGGMAGVGKTALAVHWAHQVAGQFPDGQLYVNLRGFGPSGEPVSPEGAIRGFLGALGVAAQRIPPDPQAQAGLYRSLLADRQMLIILDNARDEDQVRPLLPASPACLVVVTSRTELAGLIAAEGAQPVNLDVLTDAEAQQLLAHRLGGQRVAAEPDAVGELTGLDALDAGDSTTSVQAVFSWSYQRLTLIAARMFRLLGLHPGTDITEPAAASLAGVHAGQARGLLRELARANLLAELAPGRYAFHDLLRAYAARQANAVGREPDRRAALTRLFDYYLAAAAAAMDILAPAEASRRPPVPTPPTPLPPLGTPSAARAWLDAERTTFVAVAGHTATHGWPSHTIRLAAILFRYFDVTAHYSDALAVHSHALHAAQQSGDRAAQAGALKNCGCVSWRQGHYQKAADQIEQALVIYRELDDRHGLARTLGNLGLILLRQGRYREASGHHKQAIAFSREVGDRFGQAIELDNLGVVLYRQGRYEEAVGYHRRSLDLRRELGDRRGEAGVLDNLGMVLWRQGRYQEAADHLQRALALFREFGFRDGEAEVLNNLGAVMCSQGQYDLAAGHHRQARAIFGNTGNRLGEAEALSNLGVALYGQRKYDLAAGHHRQARAIFGDMGNRLGEAEALNGLGEASSATGGHEQARAQHNEALAVACQVGDRYQEARAHEGLAATYHAAGDPGRARHHWQRALALYTGLGVPEAGQVRAKLDSMSPAVG